MLSKCYKISAKYRQKKAFSSFLEEKDYRAISKPIKVRWNSEIECLKTICKIKLVDLNEGLQKIEASNLLLSSNDMSRLIDIVNILEPFEYVSNEIQGMKQFWFVKKLINVIIFKRRKLLHVKFGCPQFVSAYWWS